MRNINFKLFLLGCLVASSRMDHKEDPMGKVKTYIALQNKDYDYYYIKFTFSGCGVECMTVKKLCIMNSFTTKRRENVNKSVDRQ